ncbi:hypothetical protein CMO96_02935 [Candidatus Woesebacteria bacterium]|nr:hypothetical protein [Candidatus Woesebacteria bacterium]|tara:strand:+ start:373 stop:1215 length:843 start_codon:yes stop_codon:yes gene_type:complete
MKVWAHTLVKNEERYLWYAVMSIVPHVDKVLLWDTGSTDNTIKIAKEIKKVVGDKIDFSEVGNVDVGEFTTVRQKMLDSTAGDWFIIVDGDEVWWEDSIKDVVRTIQSNSGLESVVSPYYNIVRDIYHYQSSIAGKYNIDGRRGFINIRAASRKIPGLHFEKPHGQQGLYDQSGTLLQNRTQDHRKFIDAPYLHFTNVTRSSTREKDLNVPKRDLKFKYELGIPFPRDFYYPEVFFRPKPDIIPSPWRRSTIAYNVRAAFESPAKFVKRKFLLSTSTTGY